MLKLQNVSYEYNSNIIHQLSIRNYISNYVGVNFTVKNRLASLKALKNITLEVTRGSCLGIYGHNGSGKTTLLRLCAGIFKPTNGKITLPKKIVSMIELGCGILPDYSGFENIKRVYYIFSGNKNVSNRKIDEIISFSELGKYIYLPYKNYSSGMQMRLYFSIVMLIEAEQYVIDEHIYVGDKNFSDKSKSFFLQKKKQNKTLLVTSQNYDKLNSFCDNIIEIKNGEIIKYF